MGKTVGHAIERFGTGLQFGSAHEFLCLLADCAHASKTCDDDDADDFMIMMFVAVHLDVCVT